jgi:hypothetical protein
MMVVIFYYVPILFRSGTIAIFNTIAIFGTIISWGLFYSVMKLSNGSFINVEVAFFVPLMLLSFLSIYFYKKL